MIHRFTWILGAAVALSGTTALANSAAADVDVRGAAELPPYLQCVPYARDVSGIQIYGDAHTWWGQAKGRYKRGDTPKVGAVMAFKPHRNMRLGHVAAVSRVIDSRTIELRHSNWSPINGRRGQIEDNVKAIDVSPNNDWSEVRVWYHPIQALGKTPWPVHGFIYNGKGRVAKPVKRSLAPTPVARAAPPKPVVRAETAVRAKTSRAFLDAFGAGATTTKTRRVSHAPQRRTKPAPRPAQSQERKSGPVDLIAELVEKKR